MDFNPRHLNHQHLINIYQHLLFPRLVEEKMLILLRQEKIGKWFSGIGQEAIAIGCTLALKSDEYILPMHRNLGVFTSRNIPLWKLMAQWQGKATGFTKGRDRSFHFGTQEHHIIGMISHLGPQLAVANGIALADKLANKQKVTLAFTGEGATSEGDFHEALNVAAVWDLPVIFVIENNGYALSTPTKEQYRCENLVDKAKGYGIEGVKIDGNNILEVYHTINSLAKDLRVNPRPVLVECVTFRMRGHEEASGVKYVPQNLFEEWMVKDPLKNYEDFLLEQQILTPEDIDSYHQKYKLHINQEVEKAFLQPEPVANMETELNDMYFPSLEKGEFEITETKEGRYIDAISWSLDLMMQKHQNLVLMGQDIAEYGGAFKITQGFIEKFGKERVRNTPICESAIVGASLGLAINGYKAVMEMQFADFATCGFNQIVNNLAKTHYRWGQKVDVVIRMPTGAGTGAGPFHSQSNEAWFTKTPGLKVVYPAFADDAYGLLNAAIEDGNPVLYFEHKYLYRKNNGQIPVGVYFVPIGKAKLRKEGTQFSLITYGLGVHWALDFAEENPDISFDILDLRSLLPWDKEAVFTSAKKTGRVLVLHEDTISYGIGAELAASITENCFQFLDSPVLRCGSLDTTIPMNKRLEVQFLAKSYLKEKIDELLNY
ncbi:alpha-ketoacid dehydrogenase subunit alpha/beta [Pedobacter alpinus]|uniref:Thiamine pyrophosphate-dependent enzyme n=1 Tax=Pedobacter alpinus TaxID=1590643 RepID=A0ABW5TMT4_9SPHI